MKQNWDKELLETYRRMFKISRPEGDFDKLVENAPLNEWKEKDIPFNDFLINEDDYDKIINDIIKEYKIPKYIRQRYKQTIALGCSPKIKKNEIK